MHGTCRPSNDTQKNHNEMRCIDIFLSLELDPFYAMSHVYR